MAEITEHEIEQLSSANASGRVPVVFVHGLWLLPSSWDRWRELFAQAGYASVSPGWPDDPETVDEARAQPGLFARKSVGKVAEHYGDVIAKLDRKPVVVGHSFGGLLTEILAGRGLSSASVAISPAPFRGVLPLPLSALRSASPALHNPVNRERAVPLTYEQFRYAFANALDEEEAKALYDQFSVPGSGEPIFQAATANLNPWTEVKVRTKRSDRGPMLIVYGGKDHTVPPSIAKASFRKQHRNENVTESLELDDRGHSLTIDHGWSDVARSALQVALRFAHP
jgi:pimeloyl-ACP methyl ester carboxylesterase